MAGPSWVKYVPGDGYSYGARTTGLRADEQFFVDNMERAETLAESTDPHSNYDFDDWALALLDGQYYVFNATGCSCPSPEETWSLAFKGSPAELLGYLDTPENRTSEAFNEFLREIEKAGLVLLTKAPEPSNNRYNW